MLDPFKRVRSRLRTSRVVARIPAFRLPRRLEQVKSLLCLTSPIKWHDLPYRVYVGKKTDMLTKVLLHFFALHLLFVSAKGSLHTCALTCISLAEDGLHDDCPDWNLATGVIARLLCLPRSLRCVSISIAQHRTSPNLTGMQPNQTAP